MKIQQTLMYLLGLITTIQALIVPAAFTSLAESSSELYKRKGGCSGRVRGSTSGRSGSKDSSDNTCRSSKRGRGSTRGKNDDTGQYGSSGSADSRGGTRKLFWATRLWNVCMSNSGVHSETVTEGALNGSNHVLWTRFKHFIKRERSINEPCVRLPEQRERHKDGCNLGFEPLIRGCLHLKQGKTATEALADWGAGRNIMSWRNCIQHHLKIDRRKAADLLLASGSKTRTLGAVKVKFSFAGENKVHMLEFQVLQRSTHDLILGQLFLHETCTFTDFPDRVKRVARDLPSKSRICFLGGRHTVSGSFNGESVFACLDTGSDINLISAEYARRRALKVDRTPSAQQNLEFADRTTAKTVGTAHSIEWRYGEDNRAYLMDAYVLDGLPVDVLLGFNFIHETRAFTFHRPALIDLEDLDSEDDCTRTIAFVIKLINVESLVHAMKRKLLRRPKPSRQRSDEEERQAKRYARLERLNEGLENVESNAILPSDLRHQEIAALNADWEESMRAESLQPTLADASCSVV